MHVVFKSVFYTFFYYIKRSMAARANVMTCHYEMLGVSRDAPLDAIKRAYRTMALRWHVRIRRQAYVSYSQFFVPAAHAE